jgi:hypothetical protein
MSDATTTPAAPPPSVEASIHDAVDALFASKEPAAETPAEETVTEETTVETSEETTTEEAPAEAEAPKEEAKPEPPKKSASDYAIEIARAKKKLAAVQAQLPKAEAPKQPSQKALERALALEAAGDDPIKRFEAAQLDLAEVVKAFDQRMAADPDSNDPLAKKIEELALMNKTLAEKLSQFEEAQVAASDAQAIGDFLAAAEKTAKSSEQYELVTAYGQEGLDLVLNLVLEARKGDPEKKIAPRIMPLAEALQTAEAYYESLVAPATKTKKLASKFKTEPAPKKPSIGGAAPTAGKAPVEKTPARSVQDVINSEIDRLLGARGA